jgi:hypothetical protein
VAELILCNSTEIIIIMSSGEERAADEVCANCGKSAVDDVTLKKCACNLVKYCGVGCQRNHRPQHKKACKNQMAEIRGDRLFTLPEISHLGECPICLLPLPLDMKKSTMFSCCSKLICKGCEYANLKREAEENLDHRCPFCRHPQPENDTECEKLALERVEKNDPVAMRQMGSKCVSEGDFERAFEYLTKAAALGDIDAHYNLSFFYDQGYGGIERDQKKDLYHMEEAAIGGHPDARYNLGFVENGKGRIDRAMRHFVIASKLGHDIALERVKLAFRMGLVSKEDYEAALCGHRAAVDATKSKQREEGYAFFNIGD